MLTLRHLVIEDDGTYRANPNELVLLQYYANAIVHLFRDRERRTGAVVITRAGAAQAGDPVFQRQQ